MKVMFVFGTRPEVIKLAPVIRCLQTQPAVELVNVASGQHREMLDQVLNIFAIRPDYDFNLMRPDQNRYELTSAVLLKMQEVLEKEKPAVLVVQGDTNTVVAAAIAAQYAKVPVAHVEAGLRTGDRMQPFPEELNRQMCDSISDLLFPPTELARANLLREGHPTERIIVTGNTGIDALLQVTEKVRPLPAPPSMPEDLRKHLRRITGEGKRLILATSHRRENFGEAIENIALTLKDLAEGNDDIEIIYPVHLNPNVQNPVHQLLDGCDRVHLTPPLMYDAFVWLMDRCYFIMTDSGGIQEEAPALGKPVLVLREKTERPEAIEAGTARLVGTRYETIRQEAQRLLDDERLYQQMAKTIRPFGDGKAAGRIAHALQERYDSQGNNQNVRVYTLSRRVKCKPRRRQSIAERTGGHFAG